MKTKIWLFLLLFPISVFTQEFFDYLNYGNSHVFQNRSDKKKVEKIVEHSLIHDPHPKLINPKNKYVYVYDRKQRLREFRRFVPDDQLRGSSLYFYDVLGRLVKIKHEDFSAWREEKKWETRYGYDIKGRNTSISYYDSENYSMGWKEYLDFNEFDHPTRIKRFDENRELTSMKEAFYNYDTNWMTVDYFNKEMDLLNSKEYLIYLQKEKNNPDSPYKFNNEGDIIYMVSNKGKKNEVIYTYQFEYDQWGNWIRRETYKEKADENGVMLKKLHSTTTKEIKYR